MSSADAKPTSSIPGNAQDDDSAQALDKGAGDGDSGALELGAKEIGGRDGLDPTRYGDWEKNGRCIDF